MTHTAVVVGIDVGTTSAKAVLVDRSGSVLGEGNSGAIETITEVPGAAEQRPADVLEAVRDACLDALASAGAGVVPAAVAMGSQSGSVVAVDRQMAPLSRLLTWMDARAEPLVEGWGYEVRQTVRSISGWSASPGLGLASIAWLGRNGASVDARFGPVDAYIAAIMSGRFATNPSNAAGVQLMNLDSLTWSEDLCSLAGISTQQLPELTACGADLGEVDERFGLGVQARLVAGGHDQTCAALALGVTDPGQVFLSAGTAWVLTSVAATGSLTQVPGTFNVSPHVVPDRWTTSTNIGAMGAVVAWALNAVPLGAVEDDSPLFVPSLLEADRTAWGRFEGSREPVLGCVFEACGFEVRRALEATGDNRGSGSLVMVGGGVRSHELVQAISDMTGRSITVRSDGPWPALGAARLAARSIGWGLLDIEASAGGYVVRPSRDNAADPTTQPRYARYLDLTSGDHK